MTIDIKITKDGDIDLSGNAFELASDIDYIDQKLAIVLRSCLGDVFFYFITGIN